MLYLILFLKIHLNNAVQTIKCSYKLFEDLSDKVLKIPQNKILIFKHIKYIDNILTIICSTIIFVSYDSERAEWII